jgi:hypothetical protein
MVSYQNSAFYRKSVRFLRQQNLSCHKEIQSTQHPTTDLPPLQNSSPPTQPIHQEITSTVVYLERDTATSQRLRKQTSIPSSDRFGCGYDI